MSLQDAWDRYYHKVINTRPLTEKQVDLWWQEFADVVQEAGLEIINVSDYGCILSDGQTFVDSRRAPEKIMIDPLKHNVSEKSTIKRNLIGMMVFKTAQDFEDWQYEAPREIFEVTPTFSENNIRIFVTYNAGIIDS